MPGPSPRRSLVDRGATRCRAARSRPAARAGVALGEGGAPRGRRMILGRSGFTAVELMVTFAIIAIVAAVSVPSAARLQADAAARSAAQRLALVLRAAQAHAAADDVPVEVHVPGDGSYEVVERTQVPVLLERGHMGALSTTNYPGGGVEFAPAGWPCSLVTHLPRAGTFTFFGGVAPHTVTLQMGGRTRWQ
jgi:prepilin-type N-terminal cleavage/methylation domain-containing protein